MEKCWSVDLHFPFELSIAKLNLNKKKVSFTKDVPVMCHRVENWMLATNVWPRFSVNCILNKIGTHHVLRMNPLIFKVKGHGHCASMGMPFFVTLMLISLQYCSMLQG